MHATTDFSGGSAEISACTEGRLYFAALKGESPRSMWWHLRLRKKGGKPVRCVWQRTEEVLGGSSLAAAVAVYRVPGGAWRRLDPRSCSFDVSRGEFAFRLPGGLNECEVAYCYPYGIDELAVLRRRLALFPEFRVLPLGRTGMGREYEKWELGARGDAADLHIWLTARHHAGEVPGSFVLEGFLDAAVKLPALLRRACLHIFPLVDLDGVVEGMYGKDRAPVDFNRDYCTRPQRPEIAAIVAEGERIGRADIFIDLHAPAPGDCSFVVPGHPSFATDGHWEALWEFAAQLEALAPRSCPVRVADRSSNAMNWAAENSDQTAKIWFNRRFGALGLTLETTYHRSYNGKLVSPRGWRALGGALLRATAAHVGLASSPETAATIARPVFPAALTDNWLPVHLPREVKYAEKNGHLVIEGHGKDSYLWLATRQIWPGGTQGRWRLTGSLQQVELTAKEVEGPLLLPTGRWQPFTGWNRPTLRWQALAPATSLGDCRLLLKIIGLDGRLELDFGR